MADDVIDAYLIELRRALSGRADLDDVCAEVEDHLRENVTQLVAAGIEPAEAQRRTLECFGDLGLVARSFSVAPTGHLAVPTTFTRRSGQVAVGAGVAWPVAAVAGWAAASSLRVAGWSTYLYLPFALTALLATAVTTVALLGLAGRAGGLRSRTTVAVIGLAVISVVVVGALALMWAIMMLLMAVAGVLALRALRSVGLDRPVLSALLIVAWPLGAGLLYVTNEVWPIGYQDAYGDHPLAFALSFTVAAVLFAAGLIGYGRRLSQEVPAELPAQAAPAGGATS